LCQNKGCTLGSLSCQMCARRKNKQINIYFIRDTPSRLLFGLKVSLGSLCICLHGLVVRLCYFEGSC
jgi:hypothetical protein